MPCAGSPPEAPAWHIGSACSARHLGPWGETCVGFRPCTPFMDKFDVRMPNDASLLAENLPALCAGVDWQAT